MPSSNEREDSHGEVGDGPQEVGVVEEESGSTSTITSDSDFPSQDGGEGDDEDTNSSR